MSETTLPLTYHGGVRYRWNLVSFLRKLPKEFAVLWRFDKPLPVEGIQPFTGSMEIALWLPTMATCTPGAGIFNFDQKSVTFQADSGYVHFEGTFHPQNLEIAGAITIKDVRNPHKIVFAPFEEF